RYATAADFARDLEAAREGRPIAARPPSLAYSAWRQARRHPLRTMVAAALVFAAAASFGTFDLSKRAPQRRIKEDFKEDMDKAMETASGRDRGLEATQRVMEAIEHQQKPEPKDVALFESEVEDPRFSKRWEDLLRSPLDPKARAFVEESMKPRI